MAAFIAYDVEKKLSKHPEKWGTGIIEGVAAPEGANNSAAGGGMVPLLTLGIPPSAPLAVLLGAFMLHGLRPGPLPVRAEPPVCVGIDSQHVCRERYVARTEFALLWDCGPDW